ncbi:hypothetical protein [Nocardiopsis baichengensis]|uniref:hypothetical protein n=1 Tax=Nocardiopsis baichengensis TaxID=280240 RepID=UPI00126979B9|nr:hypothetical protein [Nocardiopsis baichengensis]
MSGITWLSLIAIITSIAAAATSILAFIYSRKIDKRELFLRLHHQMTQLDAQKGRRLLHQAKKRGRMPIDKERDLINHAMALLDIVGFYQEKGHIKEREVMKLWGATFLQLEEAGKWFIKRRTIEENRHGQDLWPFFKDMCDNAHKHHAARQLSRLK